MGSRAMIIALFVLLALNVGFRLVRVRADSPPLTNKFRHVDTYKDEGEKAHEARNRALFGTWRISPADNFSFWRVQSPVWTYSLFAWFKLAGVNYARLRFFSIMWTTVALGAGSFMLYRKEYVFAALLFPLLLGFNYYFFIITRLGLMEPMTLALTALAALFLAESPSRPALFLPSTVFLLLAVLTKQTALLFVPAWAGYLLRIFFQPRPPAPAGRSPIPWLIFSLVLMLGVLLLFFLSAGYRDLASLNFRHVLFYEGEMDSELLRQRFHRFILNYYPGRLWRGYFKILPAASLLGTGWMIYLILRLVRREAVSDLEWMCLAWFLFGRVAATASPTQVVRFHFYYFFPLSILAALAAERLWKAGRVVADAGDRSRLGRGLVVLAVIYELSMTAVPWAKWVKAPPYDLVTGSRRLGELLAEEEKAGGRPPVVIGEWAGPLSLENHVRCHYVKGWFNQEPWRLQALGITHLLETDNPLDFSVTRFRDALPSVYAGREFITRLSVRGRTLILWRVSTPEEEPYLYPEEEKHEGRTKVEGN